MQDRIELTKYRTNTTKTFLKQNGDIQIEIYKSSSSSNTAKKSKSTSSVTGLIDTYIFDGDSDTTTYNLDKLLIGTDVDTSYRSLVKFTLPTIPTNYRLVEAKLNLTYYPVSEGDETYKGPKIVAHKLNTSWTEATAKWSSMNDKYEDKIYDYVFTRQSKLTTGTIDALVASINITNMVQEWYNGEANNGLMLKWNDENYSEENPFAELISNNSSLGESVLPSVTLTFKNYNGIESYLSYTSQQHFFGSSHICNYTGNLTSTFEVANTIGGPFPANLYLVYNTGSVILGEDYGYGIGIKLNYNQTLTIIDDNTIHYLDEDGTIHIFKCAVHGI